MLFNLENINNKLRFCHILPDEFKKGNGVASALKHICGVYDVNAGNGLQGSEIEISTFHMNLFR